MRNLTRILLWMIIIAALAAGLLAWLWPGLASGSGSRARDQRVLAFLRQPDQHSDWKILAGQRCGSAPFQMPSDGYIGYLWDDSFRPGHRHQGIDIFSGSEVGVTPVFAAYSGYLTRQADWKSSLIIRLPDDPLTPGRQIWTYYTHMADAQGSSLIDSLFPPDTHEVWVEAGTRLGTQGNYSGTPGAPVGVHLHFSIVRDDGQGKYSNELDIENTIDPSPYLGMQVNVHHQPLDIPACSDSFSGDTP